MTKNNLSEQIRALGPYANPVSQMIDAALAAVDPRRAVHYALQRFNRLRPGDGCGRLGLISVGKAAIPMAWGALDLLADDILAGIVVPKHIPLDMPALPPRFRIIPGAHPTPDDHSLAAGKAVLSFLSGFNAEDRIICLISGGGSSLLVSPVPAISLSDLQQLTTQLLACGASITEINVLRKHLDQVKGGGLAHAAAPAKIDTFILSDVIGNPLDAIASGPTAPDPSTYAQALAVLEKYDLLSIAPVSVVAFLRQGFAGLLPETLKPGAPVFRNATHTIIADNTTAVQAALAQGVRIGFDVGRINLALQGEARQVGVGLAQEVLRVSAQRGNNRPPLCLVGGGEATVNLRSNGVGGRNLELSLAAVPILSDVKHVALITLATDGEDGPTDAAGALVTGETMQKARRMNLDPADFLARNDSYTFFEQTGGLIKTGPTGTNVNDLAFLVIYAS